MPTAGHKEGSVRQSPGLLRRRKLHPQRQQAENTPNGVLRWYRRNMKRALLPPRGNAAPELFGPYSMYANSSLAAALRPSSRSSRIELIGNPSRSSPNTWCKPRGSDHRQSLCNQAFSMRCGAPRRRCGSECSQFCSCQILKIQHGSSPIPHFVRGHSALFGRRKGSGGAAAGARKNRGRGPADNHPLLPYIRP
jgi:hypothetical protein